MISEIVILKITVYLQVKFKLRLLCQKEKILLRFLLPEGFIGSAISLLYAPKKGSDMREDIRHKLLTILSKLLMIFRGNILNRQDSLKKTLSKKLIIFIN